MQVVQVSELPRCRMVEVQDTDKVSSWEEGVDMVQVVLEEDYLSSDHQSETITVEVSKRNILNHELCQYHHRMFSSKFSRTMVIRE